MQKIVKFTAPLLLIATMMVLFAECKKKDPPVVTVQTYEPSQVTKHSAKLGGKVVVRNDSITITELGICLGVERNPTIEDQHWSTNECDAPFVYDATSLVPGIKYHVRAYAIGSMGLLYGLDRSFVTIDEEYVDFGLPSGTLWATCNIGASSPEKYGEYFAWGETRSKSSYSWSNYNYCIGSNTSLTRYCTLGSYGSVDNRTTLLANDDAAHVIWGNGWRVPTRDQWDELNRYTTSRETYLNGVKGREYSENGYSIFLPYAGCYWRYELMDVRTDGYYWSNEILRESPDCAWYFDVSTDSWKRGDGYRSYGQSIRPVWNVN